MKKYLLLFVSVVAFAFNAFAGGGGTQLTYFFTFRATVEATGAGKVYVSFDGYDEASNDQLTVAEKHRSTDQAIKPSVYNDGDVRLYYVTAAEEGSVFKGLVNKATGEVVKKGVEGRIDNFKSNMMCGQFDDDHEEDCIAQHTEEVNNHVDSAYIAVFRPEEVTPATVSFDKETGEYNDFVDVKANVENLPEFCKLAYKFEAKVEEETEEGLLKAVPAGFLPYPEEGLRINESGTLTVVAADELTGEVYGGSEVEYVISHAPVTGINDVNVNAAKVVKTIENGQVVIVKDNVKYNVAGQAIK